MVLGIIGGSESPPRNRGMIQPATTLSQGTLCTNRWTLNTLGLPPEKFGRFYWVGDWKFLKLEEY